MCGIAGWINHDGSPINIEKLGKMGDVLAHRGPDASGNWSEGGTGFAHKRLSIIDIEGGAQPMLSASGRYAITYNGELYNFRELREKYLMDYPFSTSSDTEVILASYERWGESCVTRFNGIFAFAIWDREERRLFCARDHYGVKQFYYTGNGKRLLFASEIKSLLAAEPSLAEMNFDALNRALIYRYSPSPDTLFKDVEKLRPGHFLICEKGKVSIERYFYREMSNGKSDPREFEDMASQKLDDAVRRQLVADVPVGALLSGGVDSTLLTTLASRHYGSSLTAFTVGFKGGGGTDERKLAESTAKRLGIRHEKLEIDAGDFFSAFEKTVYHLEEPIATTSALPLFLLCGEIAKSHKVVLSGQGVDELFGGYFRHLAEKLSGGVRPVFASGIISKLLSAGAGSGKLGRAFYSLGEKDDLKRFMKIFSLFNMEARAGLMRSVPEEDISPLRYYLGDLKDMDSLNRMLYLELRTSLADDLLFYTDKVSMAHSVEVRVPFLDRDFASYVESLSSDHKIRGWKRKHLFRQIAKRHIPSEVLNRKKLGFETPFDEWLRKDLFSLVRETVCDPSSFSSQIFRDGAVESMLNLHAEGKGNFSKQLFMILSLEIWSKKFGIKAG